MWWSLGSWNRKVIQDHPVIPKWNHSVLIGRRQAEGESIRGQGGKGWNDGLWGWRKGPRSGIQATTRGRKSQGCESPPALWRGHTSGNTFISAHWQSFQISGLQNCKTLNLCCFKPARTVVSYCSSHGKLIIQALKIQGGVCLKTQCLGWEFLVSLWPIVT